MAEYHILGLTDELTAEVRRTLRAPEYGHPVLREVAGGTGPCRACLEQFKVGEERRDCSLPTAPQVVTKHWGHLGRSSSMLRCVANTVARSSRLDFGRFR
jgi:hypothetical protein